MAPAALGGGTRSQVSLVHPSLLPSHPERVCPPPPGLPFFPESSSPGELCGTADPSAEDWGSGTFCEGALLSPICMKWVQSSLCEDLEPTRCL